MPDYTDNGIGKPLPDEGEPYVPPAGWTHITCGNCAGFGVVSLYSARDFEGPGECRTCGGNGMVWRTPKGKFAQYPGGPFCG